MMEQYNWNLLRRHIAGLPAIHNQTKRRRKPRRCGKSWVINYNGRRCGSQNYRPVPPGKKGARLDFKR